MTCPFCGGLPVWIHGHPSSTEVTRVADDPLRAGVPDRSTSRSWLYLAIDTRRELLRALGGHRCTGRR